MIHWQQYNEDERLQLLNIVSAEMNLPRLAVEKDWWVSAVLKAISMSRYADLYSLKGGTSLSKGWKLIERFSEDADIAMKREDRFAINGTSKTQLAKVRRAARHYILRELPDELSDILSGMGIKDFILEPETCRFRDGKEIELRADTHPSVLFVHYKSILPEASDYLLPKVKIEVSCLSMDEPVEDKEIRSFLSEIRPHSDEMCVNFKTVVPTRTFLEKMFLLHEEFQKKSPRSKRMSRHLYDLERIMDTEYGKEALASRELFNEIILHRSIYNKIEGMNYSLHSPTSLNFIPPQHLRYEWENDYEALVDQFLYYSEDRITFENLITRMEELLSRVRML